MVSVESVNQYRTDLDSSSRHLFFLSLQI